MGAFMQMGHDTKNLVGEKDLLGFDGIVMSPVNREPADLEQDMLEFRGRGDYHIVLDPQLYVPQSERGYLSKYSYFPSDFDSADLTSKKWWQSQTKQLGTYSMKLGVDSVASPAILPRSWSDEYFTFCVAKANFLEEQLRGKQKVWQTLVVELGALGSMDNVFRIASIISQTKCSAYYLVIVCSGEPRRELADSQGLAGAMHLVHLLESSEKPVLVAYSSSDMILYKAAGASHCGTGKFFNLRRFTPSRFGEEKKGGGQQAYWFEHSLVAFLREGDIQLLREQGRTDCLASGNSENHWGGQILDLLSEDKGTAWVGMGWRQYLSWFWRTEHELNAHALVETKNWLKEAESRWLALDDDEVLFDDPRNNGNWIRPWRQALISFGKTIQSSET